MANKVGGTVLISIRTTISSSNQQNTSSRPRHGHGTYSYCTCSISRHIVEQASGVPACSQKIEQLAACVCSNRSRTGRRGPGDPMTNQQRRASGAAVRRLMHGEDDRRNGDTPERRDWAKLPRDLAAEIAGCLLGIDLTEYIRFRAVCKPWRRSTDDPRVLNSRFFPRNWVMLSNYGEDTRRRLLNVATGASIVDDFPELSGHHPLGYAEGLLVLSNTATTGIRLFNPLTRAVTDLPGFSSWPPASFSALKAAAEDGAALFYRGFCVIDGGCGGAASSPPTVVLFLSSKAPLLAFIRPGESHWALADTSELTCSAYQVSVLSLHGRFYLSTSTGDVLTVELHPEPRLVHVVRKTATATPTTTTVPAMCSFYLAPSGDGVGMLMIMVHAHASGEDEDHGEQVEVFEVDVDGRKLIPKSTVGADRALFLGSVRPLSISTKLFPSIASSANAVYFCHGQGSGSNLFSVFHMDNGRVEPAVEFEFFEQMQERGPFFGPFNLDVYLACCVDVAFGAFGI